MNARGARAKGRKWDNEVAERLSQWFFGVHDGLMRTHGSRGRKGFRDQVGDLGIARTDLPRTWVFGVENKHRDRFSGPKRKTGAQRPAWSLDDILQVGAKASIYEYWYQCRQEADRGNKIPLLVLKRNYLKPIVGVRRTDWEATIPSRETPPVVIYAPKNLMLMRFEVFLQTDPDAWVARWKEVYGSL